MSEDALLELLASLGAVVFGIIFWFVDASMRTDWPHHPLPRASAHAVATRRLHVKLTQKIRPVRIWQLYGAVLVSLVISSCVVMLLAGLIYLVPHMFS